MGLSELRERLDAVDDQIIALLSERARMIVQVADFKRRHNLPIYIPEREAAIVKRLCALNPGPLGHEAIDRIYRTIIEEMRKCEYQHAAP